jgi:quinol monooxygenase YgiN
MPICKMARFRVKREAVRQCTAAIREFVTYVKAHEPGTRLYISLQDPRDRTRFLHVMVFKNAAAERQHHASAAAKKLTNLIYPQAIELPEFVDLRLITST